MGPADWIYPRGKHRNFLFFAQIFFANSESIFAIRDPKLPQRALEHTLETAQYRGLFFTFIPEEPKHYPTYLALEFVTFGEALFFVLFTFVVIFLPRLS